MAGKATVWVTVEWRDRTGQYRCGCFRRPELAALAASLRAQGVVSVVVDDEELATALWLA